MDFFNHQGSQGLFRGPKVFYLVRYGHNFNLQPKYFVSLVDHNFVPSCLSGKNPQCKSIRIFSVQFFFPRFISALNLPHPFYPREPKNHEKICFNLDRFIDPTILCLCPASAREFSFVENFREWFGAAILSFWHHPCHLSRGF